MWLSSRRWRENSVLSLGARTRRDGRAVFPVRPRRGQSVTAQQSRGEMPGARTGVVVVLVCFVVVFGFLITIYKQLLPLPELQANNLFLWYLKAEGWPLGGKACLGDKRRRSAASRDLLQVSVSRNVKNESADSVSILVATWA